MSARPVEFWSKVTKSDGCWLWTGRPNRDGYGEYWSAGSRQMAHRWAWQERHGPVPAGLVVMHVCDVPACVRPDHLRLGTQAENIADKVSKRRQARGSRHAKARMTEAQVLGLRREYADKGKPHGFFSETARKLGLDVSSVRKAVNGQNWSWL